MSLLHPDRNHANLCILLVEDDEDDYVFIRDLLSEIDLPGYELEWASTYEAALEAALEWRHDLYLLDYRLGSRTGVELLEAARLGEATAPAIILTGIDDRDPDKRSLRAGATDFLTKRRIDAHILERSIRYSIEGKRSESLQRFLSEATRLFNASLEYSTTVGAAARVVVPELGDWSCVYVPASQERFRVAEVVHADPEREEAAGFLSEIALERTASPPVMKAMEEGHPMVLRNISEDDLSTWLEDPEERRMVRELGVSSATVIPLHGKTGVLGALVLASANGRRRYREEDTIFFQELGSRVGMALENARLYETAQEATQTRDELMSMVSHDLGNPLAAISIAAGQIEQLIDQLDREQIARFTKMIRSAAESMERLLEDLLEVGRLETGHFELRRVARPPKEILEKTVERFAPRAEAQGVDFHVDRSGPLPDIMVDPERILQVLSNLLDNALKFTSSSGSVRLTTRPEDGHLRISVSDTGQGISEDEMDHLFDRFWQSRRHHRGGAGLGLTITKEIVEAHYGQIWAESEVEEGTTFHFTIPVVDPTDLQKGAEEVPTRRATIL